MPYYNIREIPQNYPTFAVLHPPKKNGQNSLTRPKKLRKFNFNIDLPPIKSLLTNLEGISRIWSVLELLPEFTRHRVALRLGILK